MVGLGAVWVACLRGPLPPSDVPGALAIILGAFLPSVLGKGLARAGGLRLGLTPDWRDWQGPTRMPNEWLETTAAGFPGALLAESRFSLHLALAVSW